MTFLLILYSLLAVLGSVFFVIYLWARHNASYWKRHGIPHANILPFFGNFIGILTGSRGGVQIYWDLYYNKSGENSLVFGSNIFHKPGIMIKDPELIKRVLIKDFNVFVNRYSASDLNNDKVGAANLFFVKGLKWKNLRSKLTPSFSSSKLKNMFHLKAECGEELGKCMKTLNISEKREMDVFDVIGRYSTDVIATCAFGIQANSLSNPDSEFRASGKRIFDTSPLRAIELLGTFYIPQVAKILHFKVFSKETTKFLQSIIPHVMDEREKTGIVRNDMLDTFISFRKQYREEQANHVQYGPDELEFDDDTLTAQSAIFFSAGFETSSSAVSFCLYELAKHKKIQDKLRTEIKDALKKYDGKITYEYIDSLVYLQQVLAETLRMYPPFPSLDRVYEPPDKNSKYSLAPYHQSFEIPYGMPVFIPCHAIQMDPNNFPEPNKFDPDRFLDQSIYNNGTYMPFGLGPRKCIGDRFGTIQSKIAIVNILKDNIVMPHERTPNVIKYEPRALLLKSVGGIWLNVIPDVISK